MHMAGAGGLLVPPIGHRCEYIASLHSRTPVRDEEPYTKRGEPVNAEHSGSKGKNLEKQFPIPIRGYRAQGINDSAITVKRTVPLGQW